MEENCRDKFKEITEHMKNTTVLLERYNTSLEHHMARSDRLETIVDKVEERSYSLTKKLYIMVGLLAIIQPLVLFLLK